MTIRRRFLVASSLARLIQRDRGGLRQVEGFFPEQKDRSSWVRLEENRGLLVLRTADPQGETEEQTEVPVAHAHALLDVCAGEIDYIRTPLSVGPHQVLIDQIIRPHTLHLVTLEFGNEADARDFQPLPWFGPEVTGDARYTLRELALKGLPRIPEILPTNAGLNRLLDTLENRFAARQAPASRSPAGRPEGNRQPVPANLDDIEAAMLAEMERRLQNNRT